jgi:riboflavin synthase
VDKKLGKYIIEKGSVCIDGISLTVASVAYGKETDFTVAVIPHTWENTTLSKKPLGSLVNIECDMVGKYIEHFMLFNQEFNQENEAEQESTEADSEALAEMMTNFTSFH